MTTFTAESSPELAGSPWLRAIAVYGVGPLIALILTIWVTRVVSAKQDEQLLETRATKALVEHHTAATNAQLDLIARQLAANCRVAAILAKNEAVERMCEVGR